MFSDPSSLLVLQELSMDFLCDVSCEVKADKGTLTVFDFGEVMEETEKRVRALLGYGPETVHDLRETYYIMKSRYAKRLERKINGENSDSNGLQQIGDAVGTVGSMTGDGIVKVAKVGWKVGAFTGAMIGKGANGIISKIGKANNNTENDDAASNEEEWVRVSK